MRTVQAILFLLAVFSTRATSAQIIDFHPHEGNWEALARTAIDEKFLSTISQNTFEVPFEGYSVTKAEDKTLIQPMKFDSARGTWVGVGFRLTFDHTRYLMRMIATTEPMTITVTRDEVIFDGGLLARAYEASEDPISNIKLDPRGKDLSYTQVVIDRNTLALKKIIYSQRTWGSFVTYWNGSKIISKEVHFTPHGFILPNATIYGSYDTLFDSILDGLHSKLYYQAMPGFYAKGMVEVEGRKIVIHATEAKLRLNKHRESNSREIGRPVGDRIVPVGTVEIPVILEPMTGEHDRLYFQVARGFEMCTAKKKKLVQTEWSECVDYPSHTPIESRLFEVGDLLDGTLTFRKWLEKKI